MNSNRRDSPCPAFSKEGTNNTTFFTSSVAVSSPSVAQETEIIANTSSFCGAVAVDGRGDGRVRQSFESSQQADHLRLSASFDTEQLSLRRTSRTLFSSRTHSPPRIRPTSELPPTRFTTDVPQSVPVVVRTVQRVCNGGDAVSEGAQQQQLQQGQPPPASSQKEKMSALPSCAYPVLNNLTTLQGSGLPLSAVVAPYMGQSEWITTCQVCSLCGLGVLLIGSLVERQKQWTDHEGSWVHQRNLQLRAAAHQCDLVPSMSKTATVSVPVIPSGHFIESPGDISASPVPTVTEHMSAEGASALKRMYIPHGEDEAFSKEEHASLFEKPAMGCNHFLTDTNANVHKELFNDGNGYQKTTFFEKEKEERKEECKENREEGKGNDGNKSCSDGCLSMGVNPGEIEHMMPQSIKNCQQLRRASAEEASDCKKEECDFVGTKDLDQISFSSLLQTASSALLPDDPITSHKERRLERMLATFLLKKDRGQLLLCLRRWYNLMFLRVMDGSLALNSLTPPVAGVATEAVASAKAKKLPTHPADSAKKNAFLAQTPAMCDLNMNNGGVRHVEKTSNIAFKEEVPFMSSTVKDFAHVATAGSSLSSVEMEMAKTDVSWYIRRDGRHHSRPQRAKKTRKSLESLPTTSSLESDASIAKLVSSLASPLRERVRAALRDEPQQPCAFPKTRKVLSAMRSSSVTATSSNQPFAFVGGESEAKSLPFSSMSCSTQSASGEAMLHGQGVGGVSSAAFLVKGAVVDEEPTRESRFPEAVATEVHTPQPMSIRTEDDACEERRDDCGIRGVTTEEGTPQQTSLASTTLLQQEQPIDETPEPAFSASAGENFLSASFSSSTTLSQTRDDNLHEEPIEAPINAQSSCKSLPSSFFEYCKRSEKQNGINFLLQSSCELKDRMKKEFRGVPGEFYCYYDGFYHHVLDPTSEVYFDERGCRLPMFVVRRPTLRGASPMHGRLSKTRPRSPLGPGRLNPYCNVCAARYFLVLVDENMRSVSVTPQRQRNLVGGDSQEDSCACSASSLPPGRASRSQGSRSRVPSCRSSTPVLRADERHKSSLLPPSFPPKCCGQARTKRDLHGATRSSRETAQLRSAAAALIAEDSGLCGARRDALPEEEKRLRQKVRRLRRHIKRLICRELCERPEAGFLAEDIVFLREAIRILEALLRERKACREEENGELGGTVTDE